MQPLRRWTPATTRPSSEPQPCVATVGSPRLPLAPPSDKDVAFCAEFAVHGGVATYSQGINPGVELLRMEQAGLLDLARDPAANSAVVRVSLSAAARDLLSGHRPRVSTSPQPIEAGPSRRNGFEVARGMIGAAVKAEIACGVTGLDPQRIAALQARVMARIGQIQAPF